MKHFLVTIVLISIPFLCYTQKISLEAIQSSLIGKWRFEVDSASKYYHNEVISASKTNDTMVIKQFDDKLNDGYFLLNLTDSKGDFCNGESRTGYYFIEIDCTLPLCHDERVERLPICYKIEEITKDTLTLVGYYKYTLVKVK